MKTINFLSRVGLLAALLLLTVSLHAQPGMGRGMRNPEDSPRMGRFIPNLTDDQEAKIAELRTKHLKEVTPLKNELNEKRARLQTLETADKPDMNAINKTIDEISAIRANIQKKGAAHRAEVASLLNEDQRAEFNARHASRKGGKGNGRMGRGVASCPKW